LHNFRNRCLIDTVIDAAGAAWKYRVSTFESRHVLPSSGHFMSAILLSPLSQSLIAWQQAATQSRRA
jgi:hypothetical protein